jgi:hypothetical protein
MANRRDFYFRQLVAEDEMDESCDGLENADRNIVIDANAEGVWYGLGVSERGAGQNESVDVAAGSAYDQDGQRMHVPSLQNVDVSVDYLGASTQVGSSGNEKLVGVYLKFDRVLSDPRVDGNSITVYWQRDESYEFVVRQGPEEASPATTYSALQSDEILLADIRRVYNDNTIADADIETTRRETSWVQIIGETPGIAADEVSFAPSGAWADSTTRSASDAEAGINEVATDLAGASGYAKVGAGALTATWADSGTVTPGSAQLSAVFEKVVSDLAGSNGQEKIGADALTALWENGTVVTPATAQLNAVLEKLVTDLAAKASVSDCGGDRVGVYQSSGLSINFSDGSIREALVALGTDAGSLSTTNVWTATQTFQETCTISKTSSSALNLSADSSGIFFGGQNGSSVPYNLENALQIQNVLSGANNHGRTLAFRAGNAKASGAYTGGRIRLATGSPDPGNAGLQGEILFDFDDDNDDQKRERWIPTASHQVNAGAVTEVLGGSTIAPADLQPGQIAHVEAKMFAIGNSQAGVSYRHQKAVVYRTSASTILQLVAATDVTAQTDAGWSSGPPVLQFQIVTGGSGYIRVAVTSDPSEAIDAAWALMKVTLFEEPATPDS